MSATAADPARLREDVALANWIVHRVGLVNAFGHLSARIPGTETFLFPTRASPALARAERLQGLAAAVGDASRISFLAAEEAGRLREQLDGPGPMNRAWEYYAALARAAPAPFLPSGAAPRAGL
jgi:hypothetical protein